MADVAVTPVHSRRERKQFLEFPWSHYRGDTHWIPPLRQNQKEMVGYAKTPFYEDNEVQTFLATKSGRVCGRIAAILNRGHNERFDERRGFFGFFECVDDQTVANTLFDAVRGWFTDRNIHKLRGPVNPSMNHEVGLLVDGFDSPPMFMMTYNPQYYGRLIEGHGFQKVQDLYAYWGHVEMLPKIQDKLKPVCDKIAQYCDVTLRPVDKTRFIEDVENFLDVYNRSMTNTWGFVPMSSAEVQQQARALRHLIVPEMALVAEIDGKMVGAVFGLPDYNPRIKQINGRLFPLGFWRLLRKKQNIKRIRIISANVLPEYQLMGIGLVLLDGLVPKALEWGIEEAEFSWVLESNSLSRGSLEKGGAKLIKTYRLYDWEP